MSLPRVLETSSAITAGGDNPRGFKAMFKARWAAYLHANYGSAERVAVAFDVRYQTAVNWMDGVNRPSGDIVALETTRNPEGFLEYMVAAE